ncbi:hypothetical protein GW17_00010980 [Ensete ventricosum]|nr:hypothetical protein GW17_00010980 [Ensete ventricosum]
MAGGGIIVEETTNSSTKSLLPSKVSYTRSLSRDNDELKSFWFYLGWMCIDQSS